MAFLNEVSASSYFLSPNLTLAEVGPEHGLRGPSCGVLRHEGHDVGVLGVLDLGLFGGDIGFRSGGTELLSGGGVSRVGIVDVGHRGLEIGIQSLDDGVGLHCLGIVRLHLRELLAGLFGERVDVLLARHVVIGDGVLPDDDLDVVESCRLPCPAACPGCDR